MSDNSITITTDPHDTDIESNLNNKFFSKQTKEGNMVAWDCGFEAQSEKSAGWKEIRHHCPVSSSYLGLCCIIMHFCNTSHV